MPEYEARPEEDPDDPFEEHGAAPPPSFGRLLTRVLLGLVEGGLAIGIIVLVFTGGGDRGGGSAPPSPRATGTATAPTSPPPSGQPTAPTTPPTTQPPPSPTPTLPPREPFAFGITSLGTTSLGDRVVGARDAALGVRATLSGFYDTAFVNPKTFRDGIPGSIWQAFAPWVVPRARQDIPALTLGSVTRKVNNVKVVGARLDIRVLGNSDGVPYAAYAVVAFEGRGSMKNKDRLKVSNGGRYFLRSVGGRWLILGYPGVRTQVDTNQTPPPSPTGSPTSGGNG